MSFYSNLAATAVRLIARFGKDMLLVRNNDSIDPVTGVNTTGATQYYKVKGLFKLYPDNLIDGSRITASDKMIIMDGLVEPLLTDLIRIGDYDWPIQEVQTSEPANDVLVYFVRVRK